MTVPKEAVRTGCYIFKQQYQLVHIIGYTFFGCFLCSSKVLYKSVITGKSVFFINVTLVSQVILNFSYIAISPFVSKGFLYLSKFGKIQFKEDFKRFKM